MRHRWLVMAACLCVALGQGGVVLASVYDFSAGVSAQHSVYGMSATLPMPPVVNTVPISRYSPSSSHSFLAFSDDQRLTTSVIEDPAKLLVPAWRFVFTVAEPRATVNRLDVLWEGGAGEDGLQQVWLWNAATGSYVLIGSQENFKIPLEGTVVAAITSQAADFVDANNQVTILVNYFEGGASISTDYVSLTVAGDTCGTDSQCDDGLFCNGAETCLGGICRNGTAVNCNDADACTTDTCNETTRVCDHVAINCVDSLFCNGVETCNTVLGCRPGTAINCNDSNACTADSCNEATDSCDHGAVNCVDALYCNGVESCDTILGCRPGTPVNCNDADSCTTDACNEPTDTCNHTPRTAPAAATTPSPTDGAIAVTPNVTLTWNGGTPDLVCPKVFDVYLDTVNPPVAIAVSGLAAASFTPNPLVSTTTYYWQVTVRDCCTQTTGLVWSFTTSGGTPAIVANPTALNYVVSTGQSQVQQLTLTNNGNAPTAWAASEAAAGAGNAAAAAVAVPNIAQQQVRRTATVDWNAPHHPETLVVGFKSNIAPRKNVALAQRDAVHALRKTTKVRSFQTIPADLVQVSKGADLQAVAAQYAAMPEVEFVEPNYLYQADVIPNDSGFGSLWGMHNTGQTGGVADADIDAPEAWELATGSQTVIVGVIDTGVDYTHPELAANMWTNTAERNGVAGVDDDANGIIDDIYGARWVSGTGAPTSGNPFDDHYHGTHVAGTIGGVGNNAAGVAGVNWNVKIMALKFLNSAGSGYLADAVSAIDYAVAKGAHLTSNSWGGGGYSIALKSAIDRAGAAGQLFIAAAGNSGQNADLFPMYPAAYDSPTIVSVAATDHSDLRAYFTNYGLTSVDLAAPGVNIYSTGPGNTYRFLSGTSMATPHVSGVAALVLSLRASMPPLELKQALLGSVDPIPAMAGLCVTGGRLNAHRALLMADPGPWLSLTPVSGTLWPGQSVIIDVTADARGLGQGTAYSAVIKVASGDPTSPLSVPVGLIVSPCTTDAYCSDGLTCNGAEVCGVSGACQPGTPVNCGDAVACTADACTEPAGACTHVPNNTLCDNGLVCDGAEVCDALLGCQVGTPILCNDGVACTIDQCSEALAGCDYIPDDLSCDNGVFCDGYEYCDLILGCHLPVFDPCSGQPCDEATDTCGSCTTDADCIDSIACTTESCDVATGLCNIIPDDLLCDDGLFCNGVDYCDTFLGCQLWYDPCFGLPCDENTDSCGGCLSDLDCDDFVTCTVDTCNLATNFCSHAPDNAVCDNGLFCDGVEICHTVFDCQSPNPVNCDDGVLCTDDACNEATVTCENTPNNANCDNGLFCDGIETCNPTLDCQPGTVVDCNDAVGCTVDSCNEVTLGCDHLPNNAVCDNGLFCDGSETCNPTLDCQVGAPVSCDDAIPCTVDSCNELTDVCDHALDDLACDDGLFCNGAETCAAAGCVPGAYPCLPDETCDEATDSCAAGAPDTWMMFTGSTVVPGLGKVRNEDIVAYDHVKATWSWIFDGSDVGLGSFKIDGMAVLPGGDILLSFTEIATVPGLIGGPNGLSVDGADIVRFTPTSLGAVTAGSFSFYFDGSDVGLDTTSEDIDAITLTSDGRLVVSTKANFSANGVSGLDEDLFVFTATSLGSVTAGSFAMYFDGSDVDLATTANEDIDAAGIRANGGILLSTVGLFSVTGLSGADEDAFDFTPTQLGDTTSGTYRMILDLSTLGIDPIANIAAIEEVP